MNNMQKEYEEFDDLIEKHEVNIGCKQYFEAGYTAALRRAIDLIETYNDASAVRYMLKGECDGRC